MKKTFTCIAFLLAALFPTWVFAQDCSAIVKEANTIGDLERRIQYIDKNLDRCPDYTVLLQSRFLGNILLRKYSQALPDINKCIQIYENQYAGSGSSNSSSIAPFLYYRGICMVELGNYKQGLDDLYGYTNVLGEKWETAYYKGRAKSVLGKEEAAIKLFSNAIEKKADTSIVWYERGMTFSKLRNYNNALADFQQAIKIQPDFALAHFQKGECHFALGQDEYALAAYNMGERLDSTITVYQEHKKKVLENLKLKEIRLARITVTQPGASYSVVHTPDFVLKACIQVEELEEFNIVLNGRSLQIRRDMSVKKDSCNLRIYEAIELKPGENHLHIAVKNKVGWVQSETKIIRYEITQTSQKRAALVIGNSRYQHTFPLKNPGNDADDVSAALKEMGFDVFVHKDLTHAGLIKSITDFAEIRSKYDIVMVYYSGHGIQVDGNNYLVPIDAKPEKAKEAETECVSLDRLLNDISGTQDGVNIVVLDACRTNPWSKSWRLIDPNNNPESGLAPIKAPAGSLIAFSADANQPADDCIEERNGCYTGVFLKHLKTSGQTIEQTLKKVRSEVIVKSNGKQQPAEYSKLIGADVILKRD